MKETTEILKIADIHVKRIQIAIKHMGHLFPLNPHILESLSEDDVAWLDSFVSRFGKLQDHVGSKIIDIYLIVQQENIESLTLLDKINKLERLGLIEDAELWKQMRRTRNHIAHECPDTPSLTVTYLNQIFDLAPKLINIYMNIKNRIDTSEGPE